MHSASMQLQRAGHIRGARPPALARAVLAPRERRRHGQTRRSASAAAATREEVLAERARQLYERAWSEGQVRLLDQIMAEDHVQMDMIWQPANAGGGRKRLKRGILAYRAAYPDIKFEVEDVAVVDGADKVFVSWSASGTNLGPIRDQPPSGRRVAFRGVTLVTFNADGLIQESAVFRQAPEDEARYFTSGAGAAVAAAAGSPVAGAGSSGGNGQSSSDSGGI